MGALSTSEKKGDNIMKCKGVESAIASLGVSAILTNGEKFKTAKARSDAFDRFCDTQVSCASCPATLPGGRCEFAWLTLKTKIGKKGGAK